MTKKSSQDKGLILKDMLELEDLLLAGIHCFLHHDIKRDVSPEKLDEFGESLKGKIDTVVDHIKTHCI